MRALGAAVVLVVIAAGVGATQTPVERARDLIARYHEDPARLDRARDLLEDALQRERPVDAMILLSRVYFLVGEVRAATDDERLAAYDRGREWGRRAVELAPRSEDAHVWYALNTGRWGQVKGIMRSLFLLSTVKEELDTIFALNPKSVRGHALAGNVQLELPGLLGGDRAKAEEHFRAGLSADPHFTVLRVDLARLHIAAGRYADARRELNRVVNETAPTSLADWTMRDRPRARALLDSIRDKR